MSKSKEIVAIVEGRTEQIFIQDIVSPYLVSIHFTWMAQSGVSNPEM